MKRKLKDEVNVAGLLMKIQEQLTALDRKIDSLISKAIAREFQEKPAPSPSFRTRVNAPFHGRSNQKDFHKKRFMYRATCAECKKDCEVPFRPTGDRPVYCSECYSRRKAASPFKGDTFSMAKKPSPVPAVNHEPVKTSKPPAKKKKRTSPAKKSTGKKKKAAKKKK